MTPRIHLVQPTPDPLKTLYAGIAEARRSQLEDAEAALLAAHEAFTAIGEAIPLHDARTRQLADRTAAVLRRAALDLQGLRP
jgi:hypothetical protein